MIDDDDDDADDDYDYDYDYDNINFRFGSGSFDFVQQARRKCTGEDARHAPSQAQSPETARHSKRFE